MEAVRQPTPQSSKNGRKSMKNSCTTTQVCKKNTMSSEIRVHRCGWDPRTNQRSIGKVHRNATSVVRAHRVESGNVAFCVRTCLVLSPANPRVFALYLSIGGTDTISRATKAFVATRRIQRCHVTSRDYRSGS